MNEWVTLLITIFSSVLASSGLWAYIMNRSDKKNVQTEMLLGLAHDRIMHLGMVYIDRGYITRSEYENLHEYLYNHTKNGWKRLCKESDDRSRQFTN